jgi:hypothetical protein
LKEKTKELSFLLPPLPQARSAPRGASKNKSLFASFSSEKEDF